MKGLLGVLLLFHSSMSGALAQSSLTSLLAQLPHCALTCLGTAVAESTCAATNQTCICTNVSLQTQVTVCVAKTCTIPEGLTTKNVTETACGAPVRDKTKFFVAVANSFAGLSGGAMVLRVVSKLVSRAEFGFDDYSIFVAFASGIPSSVFETHGLASNGLGRDIWTVAPKNITDYLRFFYVMEVLYFAQVFLLKLSILFFYLRIFPAPKFRKFLWGTVIFDVLFGGVFVIGGIFQCSPIHYYWDQWDGLHKGKCLNVNGLGWANAIISILLDFWMLGLAISQLVHLQLHWKKKIGVGMMFAVGMFITVVSILRLQSLVQFANSQNPTWDNLPVTMWSTIEINVGIICACMPSLRILLVKIFPKILSTTRNGSKSDYYAHGSHHRIGANVSVGKSRDVPAPAKDSKAIMYSQSYDVDLEDETYLVPMDNLPPAMPEKSRRKGGSIGAV